MVLYQAPSWNVISKRCNSLVLFVLPAAAHRNFCTSRLTALSSSNQARPRLFRSSSDTHSFILSSLFGFISNLFFSVSLIYNSSLFFCFFSRYQSLNTTESMSHSWQLMKVDPFQYFTDVIELNLFYPKQAVNIISESFSCQLVELSWHVWALNESWDFDVVTDRIVRSILQTGLFTQQHRLLETGV